MQYVIGGIVAIVLIYLAIWLFFAALLWILLPLYFVVGVLALLTGVGWAFVVLLAVLSDRHGWGPPLVTPDQVRSGAVLKRRGADPRDQAWPVYVVAQWRVDQRAIVDGMAEQIRRRWRSLRDLAGRTHVGVGILAGPPLALATAGLVLGWLALAMICAVVVLLVRAGWLLVLGPVRTVDIAVRRLRRASGSCPACYYVTDVPLFHCPSCGGAHYDIRPGKLGALWRRCACGTRLPTTVLRASGRMTATCPRCETPLRRGAAVLTDIRLPVFGPVLAGKTRLVYAGMLALRDRVAAVGGTLDFVDEDSRAAFDEGTAVILSGATTLKTSTALPPAITARLTAGGRRALLHLFDAAGESFLDRDENTSLEFLDHAQGLVFVVDPFSVPWLRDQLGGAGAPAVTRANPAVADPEQTYHLTVRRLRDFHVDTGKRRLAIAVVKADLLTGMAPAADLLSGRPGAVADWLMAAGLDNLVLAARRDFAEVGFFVVASVAGTPATDSPAAPFDWLLSRTGFAVPGRPRRSEEVA
ncbi:TRAFAC clade GTPase domain-containing protein [Actinokineospora enzanensis]|uniref:TRAFAC clade GTPase domain-containing protein n=1 Tax=Actinokineospora enzanensis TaxID=155975 RepID=UPI00036F247C|nr:zf-TFIIB domain-containing protein [Actinokineospora enzanensis]